MGSQRVSAPRISILLPVYNAEKNLAVALESALAQSESRIEILAVDDGSTDSSAAIVHEFSRVDPRVRAICKENGGVSSARNAALRNATGDWVACLDSDDWLHPRALEIWCELATSQQLDLCIGNGFRFSQKALGKRSREPLLRHQPWGEIWSGKDWIVRSVDRDEWPHYVWLQLVRRDFLMGNQMWFEENMVHEDILWTLQLGLRAARVGFVADPLYGYRKNSESIMGNLSQPAVIARAEGYLRVMHELAVAAGRLREDGNLRRALLRQCNRESGHLLGLIRRRIAGRDARSRIARRFLDDGLGHAAVMGADSFSALWRASRLWGKMWSLAR